MGMFRYVYKTLVFLPIVFFTFAGGMAFEQWARVYLDGLEQPEPEQQILGDDWIITETEQGCVVTRQREGMAR